jgi:hypothetical protein
MALYIAGDPHSPAAAELPGSSRTAARVRAAARRLPDRGERSSELTEVLLTAWLRKQEGKSGAPASAGLCARSRAAMPSSWVSLSQVVWLRSIDT